MRKLFRDYSQFITQSKSSPLKPNRCKVSSNGFSETLIFQAKILKDFKWVLYRKNNEIEITELYKIPASNAGSVKIRIEGMSGRRLIQKRC